MAKTARDLDRAYVINGSDLLIALAGMNGRPPLVPHPQDVAEYILDTIAVAKPLGANADPWAPDDDVVDAHICCEHAPESLAASELAAVDKITAILAHRSERAAKRILAYVQDYATDDAMPPF